MPTGHRAETCPRHEPVIATGADVAAGVTADLAADATAEVHDVSRSVVFLEQTRDSLHVMFALRVLQHLTLKGKLRRPRRTRADEGTLIQCDHDGRTGTQSPHHTL